MAQPVKPVPPPRHSGPTSGRQQATDISIQFQNRLKQYKTFTPTAQYETGAGSGGIDALPPSAPPASAPKGGRKPRSSVNKLLFGGDRSSFYRGETSGGRQNSGGHTKISLDQMLAVADENVSIATGSSPNAAANNALIDLMSTNVGTINAVGEGEQFAASLSARVVADPLYGDAAFLIWLKENPEASDMAVRAEMNRRNNERLAAERVARIKNLQQWNKELEELQREEEILRINRQKEEEASAFIANEAEKLKKQPLAPKPPPRGVKIQVDEQLERQRLAWSVFQNGDGSPATLKHDKPLQRVLETKEDPVMHDWVQQRWSDNTHAHERAALRIQCAFRVFLAKERVETLRFTRQDQLHHILKHEEQAMLAWEVAVATQQAESASATAVDRTFKAVQVFSQHMKSNIQYRRRAMERARAARTEVEEYAATRIQTIFRGYLARRFVREMQNPQMAVDREAHIQHQAAVKIQAIARRFLVKMEHQKKLKLVLMLQRLTRQHTATMRLARLRKIARQKEFDALRNFAASQIQNTYRAVLAKRRALLRKRLLESIPQIRELQILGRGFSARRAVAHILETRRAAAVTTVQCMYRCARARKDVKERKRLAEERAILEQQSHAAHRIERHGRGYSERKQLHQLRKETHAQHRIAAGWRGHLGRAKAREVRAARCDEQLQSRKDDAATLVQSTYRGHRARRKLSVQRDAAELIQTTVRRVIAKYDVDDAAGTNADEAEASLRIDAADCIGRFYIAHIRWPALRRSIKNSAQIIVRFMRRVPAYKTVRQMQGVVEKSINTSVEHAAAQMIQQAVRQHQARCTVRVKLDERAKSYDDLRANEAARVIARFIRMVAAKRRVMQMRIAKGLPPTYQRAPESHHSSSGSAAAPSDGH